MIFVYGIVELRQQILMVMDRRVGNFVRFRHIPLGGQGPWRQKCYFLNYIIITDD